MAFLDWMICASVRCYLQRNRVEVFASLFEGTAHFNLERGACQDFYSHDGEIVFRSRFTENFRSQVALLIVGNRDAAFARVDFGSWRWRRRFLNERKTQGEALECRENGANTG